MKRDMDLVRKILMEMEDHQDPDGVHRVNINGYSSEQIAYHLMLMHEAGLIEAVDFSGNGPLKWQARSMRWTGHEFLDATRRDDVWHKVKAQAKDKGVSLTFDTMKALAIKLAMSATGL